MLQVCIAVCVVSLEETDITPASVPYEQCREIRTEGIGTSRQLDYIIIPASAAIVATVIIAVIIFIACLKTSQKKRDEKVITISFIFTACSYLDKTDIIYDKCYLSISQPISRPFMKRNLFTL